MVFSIRDNIRDVVRDLDGLAKSELPYATALGLTATAKAVQADLVAEMQRRFDRPTRFTLRGTYVKGAKKSDLDAAVYFKTEAPGGVPAGKYLQAQIFGGARVQKSSEKALERAGFSGKGGFFVPASGVKLNQYGNVPGSTIKAILADVAAGEADQRINLNRPTRRGGVGSAGRSKRRRTVRYFVVPVGAKSRLAPGIWARTGTGIRPALLFVSGPAYRVRFPFFDIAQRSAVRHWPAAFDAGLAKALATSRAR